MSLEGKLEICGVTDVGRKRSHNEDTIGSDVDMGLAVLADGMGGYKAGEVASAIAVNLILEEVRSGLKNTKSGEIDEESGYSKESLVVKTAIEKANETIFQTAQSPPQRAVRELGQHRERTQRGGDAVEGQHAARARLVVCEIE